MFVLINNPLTKEDLTIDSLTGFVKSEPVDSFSPGLPVSETVANVATLGAERVSAIENALSATPEVFLDIPTARSG